MTDPEKPPLNDLLSSFALGPAWARASTSGKNEQKSKRDDRSPERSPQRDGRDQKDFRGGPSRDRDNPRYSPKGRDGKWEDRRPSPPQEAPPAEGIRVTVNPAIDAIRLIVKEVQQVARVYPLYDVAKILLAERNRCHTLVEVHESFPPLFRGKLDNSLFIAREEAIHHLWSSDLKNQFIEQETIEVDPPTGNFQLVSKCGLSGEWLGPPNFHAYQVNLRRLHRERFPHMPFEAYSSKVRTERGEEAVNAWLESMKSKTRWRLKGDAEDAWIDEQTEAERALATRCFDQAFEATRRADIPGSISGKNLSPSLKTSLKLAIIHARKHPAVMIPAVCKAVETEHLPVFKRQGKLFTGPVRPHPLPKDATLAPRPAIMVDWIRNNKPAKLEGLWKAVLPEGSTAPPAEFAADLFWLLHQGHILLFTDDTLVVQEVRDGAPPTPAEPTSKKKKKKKSKPAAGTQAVTSEEVTSEETPTETAEFAIVEDDSEESSEDSAPEAPESDSVSADEPATEDETPSE